MQIDSSIVLRINRWSLSEEIQFNFKSGEDFPEFYLKVNEKTFDCF